MTRVPGARRRSKARPAQESQPAPAERRVDGRSSRPRVGRRHEERQRAFTAFPEPPPLPPLVLTDAEADQRIRGFLQERLGERAAGVQLQPLAGDASTRRYYRLLHEGTGHVISVYPEPIDSEQNTFVVVRQLMAAWGIPVPEILAVDGPRGVLLLEDLGDLTLQERLRTADDGARTELYRQALDHLVRLQRESAQGAQRAVCFQIAFDFEKLAWELHFFWKNFLEGYRRCDLSVEDRVSIAEGFHRLCAEIASWPRVLTHRDFHSRNLMCHDGRLFWIDFQDARMGPATYDLASLLRDSYVDLPEELVEDLAEEFRQRAVPGESRDTFRRRLELMSVQRNLKALGTFGFQAAVKGNRVYLPYIPRTLANARRNLVRYPELSGLRRALGRHIEELA
jgi:aminoglycoside/choline kinase family phosphotransferase